MSERYFLGIDNGGTASKCVIFDQEGSIVSSASAHIPMRAGSQGETERDGQLIWQENSRIIGEAVREAGIDAGRIACVGLCGYGGGLGMLDAGGRPVAPFVVSTDSRANDLLLAMQRDGVTDALYARTLQQAWAGQPVVLLPWYKRHSPDVYRRCAHIVMIKDYVRSRLTGSLDTEWSDASAANLLNVRTRRFDEEIFRILGIEEKFACLPGRLLHPRDVAGRVTEEAAAQTGLRAGTPVAAGLYDATACCLASNIMDADTLCLIVGTWSIAGHLAGTLEECEGGNTTLMSYLDDAYFKEESSPTSASNLNWFVTQFYEKMLGPGEGSVLARCDAIVEALDPMESDVVFLPYLYGSNTFTGGRGAFFNMTGASTSEHMLLGVYEGVLFSMRQHIDDLYPNGLPRLARLSGGASRSPVWSQMLADTLDTPIEVMESSELGVLGSAICAAVACGAFPDFQTAAAKMTRVRKRYTPRAERVAVYREKYARYRNAVEGVRVFHGG